MLRSDYSLNNKKYIYYLGRRTARNPISSDLIKLLLVMFLQYELKFINIIHDPYKSMFITYYWYTRITYYNTCVTTQYAHG